MGFIHLKVFHFYDNMQTLAMFRNGKLLYIFLSLCEKMATLEVFKPFRLTHYFLHQFFIYVSSEYKLFMPMMLLQRFDSGIKMLKYFIKYIIKCFLLPVAGWSILIHSCTQYQKCLFSGWK